MKCLDFIDLVDETGRTSALSIYGNDSHTYNQMRVCGGLAHNLAFIPKTKADAEKMIKWLNDNMSSFAATE